MKRTETLIVGGGLAGVSLATALAKSGRDFHLIEARDRLGGRVLTQTARGAAFDLGPAWFWPGQPRMAKLVRQTGLRVFEQYSEGAVVYEDDCGGAQRLPDMAPMRGSLRVDGGFGALIAALSSELPPERIATSTRATVLVKTASGVAVHTDRGAIEAQRVALALPARIAATFSFEPALPAGMLGSLSSIPTWMAGQAKAVALYETPFWREAGLSGDAMSRRGPMVEIHDASPTGEGPGALFGFIGTPPQARRDATALKAAITAQLGRLFGPEAASPIDLFMKDWASDPLTATPFDQQPVRGHPHYGPLADLWDGKVMISSSETGHTFGGFLEGALEAAETAAKRIAMNAGADL